jgi:hypothetical protein
MNDLVYLLVGPAVVGLFAFIYSLSPREWKSLSREEIFKLWDDNVDKFGNVEEFARDLERAIQDKNS